MSLSKPIVGHLRLPPSGPGGSPGVDFGRLLGALLRRMHVILAAVLLGAILGFAAQTGISPRYTSSTEILLDPKRADAFGADASFANIYVDSTKIASVLSVIQSSEILGRVVATEKLADEPEFGFVTESFLARWLARNVPFLKPPILGTDRQAREERALARLRKAVRVNRVGATYVLTVDVTAGQPQTARRLAQAVAAAYINDQVDTKVAATRRDSLWLTQRLTDLRLQLEASETAVEAVRKKYGILETDPGAGVIGDHQSEAIRRKLGLSESDRRPGATLDGQAIAELSAQVLQAQGEIASRRARYEQIERIQRAGGSLDTLSDVAGSRVIEELRAKQAEALRRIAALKSVFNDKFPDLQHAKDDLRVVEGRIAAEVSRIVEGIRGEYETAVAREQTLSEKLRRATDVETNPEGVEGRMQLRQAQRVVDTNQGLYDSLLERRREVEKQQARAEPEARIISQASNPQGPSWPKPLLFPAGGAALGLLIGVGLSPVLTKLKNRFSGIAEIEKRLLLPVLATVPTLRRRDLRRARRKVTLVDYTLGNPLSRFAESLRLVRAALRISDVNSPRIVQITSAVPGEGKSTVSAALAISAARAGMRAILVDADMRRSSMSAMFRFEGDVGLAGIVGQDVPLQSALREHDDIPLEIIVAGSALSPQPDIVARPQFAALLRDLTKTYDLVVVDCPPVLAVSDALAIAGLADVTLLVIEPEATPKDVAQQAVKMLRTISAPLAGVILNKANQYDAGRRKCSRAIAKYYSGSSQK